MKAELKAKWVEALRSGKYKQATGNLRDGRSTYCCLGVLCQIAAPRKWNHESAGFHKFQAAWTEYLSAEGRAEVGLPKRQHDRLYRMNDAGKTFAKIADWIEKHVKETE